MQIKHYFGMKEIFAVPLREKGGFNRVTVKTESPLRLVCRLIIKTSGGGTVTESFPVNRGKNEYTAYISALKPNETASEISELICFNIENAVGMTTFSQISFGYKLPPERSAEVANDYLRIGYDAKYGNSLTYLSSEKYSVKHIGNKLVFGEKSGEGEKSDDGRNANLLNRHEKSRSLAQNYYGSLNPPYVPSVLFGGLWKYNPVQGGDAYGNNSDLLDFYADDKTLWFKVRPFDRAKNMSPCDSVMETEYSLDGKLLKMKCSFVDYSMFDHRWRKLRAQELPSLFLSPLLDKFFFIRDKTPVLHENLGYWAEMPFKSEQHFIVSGNYSAWLNDEGYGVGLFSPHTKHHYAGRLTIDGEDCSKDDAMSCSYTAAIGYFDLKNFEPINYEAYIAVGHKDEIRKTFDELEKDLLLGRVKI